MPFRSGLVARLEHAEDPRDLALHVVWDPDRGGFGDRAVGHRRRLELRRPDSLAGDVERVVGAAVQEPVAVFVDRRPIAVRPHSGKASPVCIEVALVVTPDAARHSGPRTFADELPDFAAQRGAVRSGAPSPYTTVAPHAPPPTTVHGPMIQPMSVAKWMRSPGLTFVW